MSDASPKPDELRLLLVDDQPAVRYAIRLRLEAEPRLETEPRFRVVGEAADIPEALAQIKATNPHLAVVDIGLGNVSGLLLARVMRERHPELRVLIWSMHARPEYVAEARGAGARGYVLKNGPMGEIVRAIATVAAGGCYYSADVDRSSLASEQLTTREKQVLVLVASGDSSPEIGKRLRISGRTVETVRRSIMSKLGAKNTAEMITLAIRLGLIDVNDISRAKS
jgi:DNA-binding NarL/FixJ family response regulator